MRESEGRVVRRSLQVADRLAAEHSVMVGREVCQQSRVVVRGRRLSQYAVAPRLILRMPGYDFFGRQCDDPSIPQGNL